MNKNYYGLEIKSRIILSEEICGDDANEILIDVEDYIGEYVKEKYNAVTGGSGKLLKVGEEQADGCDYCNTTRIKSMIGYEYMHYCPRCGKKIR